MGYAFSNSIVLKLNLLSVIIVLWLCRKMSLFLGDKCWSI